MSEQQSVDWTLLVGYSRSEAEQIVSEEGIAYEVIFSAPPHKDAGDEDVRIIATRVKKDILQLICSNVDWTVN